MAKKEVKEESLGERTEDVREEVLDGAPDAVEPITNTEVSDADTFVGTEKTVPSERNTAARAVITNHTPAGMAADIHQVLVSVSQHTRRDAEVYEEVRALYDKYKSDKELPDDVRRHMIAVKQNLEPGARAHEHVRALLEKYV